MAIYVCLVENIDSIRFLLICLAFPSEFEYSFFLTVQYLNAGKLG